ncbi:Moloney leukemia virus 10-like 1 protein [Apodemus speciosus]|uniref:Moloney leukemia virus 10-like 1 protein n=1 Tax=Apodemus speciosus TaxID=105296 RepID=A0ABQ0FU75_APOSI
MLSKRWTSRTLMNFTKTSVRERRTSWQRQEPWRWAQEVQQPDMEEGTDFSTVGEIIGHVAKAEKGAPSIKTPPRLSTTRASRTRQILSPTEEQAGCPESEEKPQAWFQDNSYFQSIQGVVTSLCKDYGWINESIFFNTDVISDNTP